MNILTSDLQIPALKYSGSEASHAAYPTPSVEPGFLVIGHRGACGHEPENTIASIYKALALGVKAIEIDVYQTTDGELMVMHDETVDRTTNGTGRTSEKSSTELRALRIKHKGEVLEATFVPFLREIIDCLPADVKLNVELKGAGTAAPLAAYLGSLSQEKLSQINVSSFDHPELLAFGKLMPTVPLGILYYGIPVNLDGDLSCFPDSVASINVSDDFISADLVKNAHEHGKKVYVYTINTPAALRRMMNLQVDGVSADYPDRINAELAQGSN